MFVRVSLVFIALNMKDFRRQQLKKFKAKKTKYTSFYMHSSLFILQTHSSGDDLRSYELEGGGDQSKTHLHQGVFDDQWFKRSSSVFTPIKTSIKSKALGTLFWEMSHVNKRLLCSYTKDSIIWPTTWVKVCQNCTCSKLILFISEFIQFNFKSTVNVLCISDELIELKNCHHVHRCLDLIPAGTKIKSFSLSL